MEGPERDRQSSEYNRLTAKIQRKWPKKRCFDVFGFDPALPGQGAGPI